MKSPRNQKLTTLSALATGNAIANDAALLSLPPRKQASPRGPHSLTSEQQMRARTLYLLRDMPPKLVAAELGCPVQSIYSLVEHRGWARLRAKNWAKADAACVEALTAETARVQHEIATEVEELTSGGIQVLRESIDARSAKDFQMASGGVRNLVEVVRRIRGLDTIQQQSQCGAGNLNFFVLTATPERSTVNVTPERSDITDTAATTLPAIDLPRESSIEIVDTPARAQPVPASQPANLQSQAASLLAKYRKPAKTKPIVS